MFIAGKTGEYINKLRIRAGLKTLGWSASAAASVAGVISIGVDKLVSLTPSSILPGFLVAFAFVASYLGRSQWGRYMRATVGLNSEKRVVREIKKTNSYALVNGAVLNDKTGDADHLILGPYCVVVETKTGHGLTRVQDGALYAGNRRIPKDPIKQANRQAMEAHRKTGIYTSAVVCVVDMTNPPFKAGNTWICSVKDLPRVLAQTPRVLDEKRAIELAKQLG